MSKKNLVILSGAGISAESGLKTFRDSDGLWMNHKIEDVATPDAFAKDPALVLEFYNMRRRDVAAAMPNAAHIGLAALEKDFNVTIITQNIDDLHERGGSSKVVHLHGEIFKMRTVKDPHTVYSISEDIQVGDLGKDGSQLRPHIVWFHEPVPMIDLAIDFLYMAEILVVIGTSLQVYPAAALLNYANPGTPVFIVDKQIPDLGLNNQYHLIEKPATEGISVLMEMLKAYQ